MIAGSNCSSSSEGESTPTTLHAGICVRQQSVSTKDAIIAREALSLLVTCLQLRCQQFCKCHTCWKKKHVKPTEYTLKVLINTQPHVSSLLSSSSIYIFIITAFPPIQLHETKSCGVCLQVLFTTFPLSMILSLIFCWDLPVER